MNIAKNLVRERIMISKADRKLLNETYKNAALSVEAIYTILDKVQDEELALELARQLGKFNSILDRAKEELEIIGDKPSKAFWKKSMLRLSVKRKSGLKKGASKIADLMIKENTKGIVGTTRSIHDNLLAKRQYTELAGELVEFEHINIDRMKTFL